MKRNVLILGPLLILNTLQCAAQEEPSPASLSTLAEKADIVAVAQIKDTDYIYTRSFPSEGSAFLKTLITYKANKPAEKIIEELLDSELEIVSAYGLEEWISITSLN